MRVSALTLIPVIWGLAKKIYYVNSDFMLESLIMVKTIGPENLDHDRLE